jgi:hypothetical protein
LDIGCKEGNGGRLGVLTDFAHKHRQRDYTVIPELSIKQTIQDWISNSGAGDNIQNMTLMFVAHGYPASHIIQVGAIALGCTPGHSTLSPDELLIQLDQFPVEIQVNLILDPVFQGRS